MGRQQVWESCRPVGGGQSGKDVTGTKKALELSQTNAVNNIRSHTGSTLGDMHKLKSSLIVSAGITSVMLLEIMTIRIRVGGEDDPVFIGRTLTQTWQLSRSALDRFQ